MFGSGSGGGFGGGFASQNGNPFAQSQGPTSAVQNPFQPRAGVKTAFGQSSGFGNQPPLPPGGMTGAPALPTTGFGNQPPLPPGGLGGAPPLPGGGFSGGPDNGNPFGQKKNSKNSRRNSKTGFGANPFGQNGAASSTSTTPGSHTTFGSASGGGPQHKNRAPAFGESASNNAFSGKSTSFVNSTPFSASGAVFGGNDAAFGEAQTGFGAPKRGQSSFMQKSGGFGAGSSGGTGPASSSGTSFGSQSGGVRVRKKQITPHATTTSQQANPFASSSGDVLNGPTTQTTFGSNSAFQSSSYGGPSQVADPLATTFGGDKKRQTTPKFGSEVSVSSFGNSDKLSSMEARMSGIKKTSKGKRATGMNAPLEQEPFQGQLSATRNSRISTADVVFGGTKAPKSSPTNGTSGKHRQQRIKKSPPIANDEAEVESGPFTASIAQDDNSKAELSAATNLDGCCIDMCSPTERELHIRVEELSVFEKCFPDRPGTESDMIIKRFQRSSADHKLDIPEEIRPPGVLRRTQLYIEQEIMDLEQFGPDPRFQPPRVPELIDLYNFCWDRFRMIRKDFVLQNYRGAGGRVHPIALDVHERIARYHVLSEHELIEVPSFVAQQNMEQLGQTLKSLNEMYDESNKMGDPAYSSPFEAECRAYFILCTLDNGRGMDVLKYVKNLPQYILESRHVKFAMRVFVARHTGDYYQFFSLLRQATYLQSCLMFRYIPSARSSALLRMNRAYRGQLYPLEDLVELLCFDDMEHAYSVCKHHKLRISGRPGAGDDSAVVVKFGGDFETDIQLRRNNDPLAVCASKIYVGMKQGNYLRRDICRGVTEHPSKEYPGLSKLIQDFEQSERAKLYPNRPPYEDAYSYFVDYREGQSAVPPTTAAPTHTKSTGFGSELTVGQQSAETEQRRQDLELIAKKKLELEKKQQEVKQRIQELQRAKEEKARQEQAKVEAIARARAEKEAEEAKQQQLQLEKQLQEQRKQRELAEQRKRAEEEARKAEQERLAAIQRAEALKAKAAEEERRLQEEKRQEELRRKAAEELERRRQQELAEARARKEREAALEAQRQAQLAKERAEKKRARRADKQRLAVLKLRLHLWRKYVQASRNASGPVAIDAAKLRLVRPHQQAKESVQWLFREPNGKAGVPIGTKRMKQVLVKETEQPSEPPEFWKSDDILGIVTPHLRRQNTASSSIAWKLVIADLLDGDSTFGLWCAVRAGTQDSTAPVQECHRTFQSNDGVTSQGVAVCCHYLNSTFSQNNTRETQQEKLAATSAILLPVDLKLFKKLQNCGLWEQRLAGLLASLTSGHRVALVVLAFGSAEIESSYSELLTSLEGCVRRLESRYASSLTQIGFELIGAKDSLPTKFALALTNAAALSPPVRLFKSVGLKELLETSLKAMMNQYQSSVSIQSMICAVFPRVRQDILSSGVMDFVYLPPELLHVGLEPLPGWNSQEKRHEIRTVLTALEVTRVTVESKQLAVKREHICDVYFNNIVDFVDRLFHSYPAATAVSTYELKKRIYSSLLPVHQQLMNGGVEDQVTLQETDSLLPWRKIFEEVYTAFFETVNDITIYYPADWQGSIPSTFGLLDAPLPSRLAAPLVVNRSIKRDYSKMKQPVKVSLKSFKKSFGSKAPNVVDESLRKYRAVGEMKRLRVEIDRERAATSQFQRMLRKELKRWNTDDGPP